VDFAVDDFLATSTFVPIAVYRKDQPRTAGSRHISRQSGFNVAVSDAEDDVAAQAEEAVQFIRNHSAEIARTRAWLGVEYLVLDFATSFRDVVVQSERFPASLVAEAGAAGLEIELTLYPAATE
jgi:hypothetical protein